jgi:CDP-diacylglycerol--inositol 3-phosphatidyltransferase
MRKSIDVFLYYPNIIGYCRVAFMIASFYVANKSWQQFVLFYLLAFVGDVVDGYVARAFNQCILVLFK